MSLDEGGATESTGEPNPIEIGGAVVIPSRLRPQDQRIFARVAMLTKVDGISESGLEALNSWYQVEWRTVHACQFTIGTETTKSLKTYFSSRPAATITAEEVEAFLNAMSLLYYGLRQDGSGESDVSKNKLFQRYYYMARENASALNSTVVMSNFLWACHKYTRDEFANTCLLDILLQAFPAALELFIRLGGVIYLKNTIDYLAANNKLRSSTNYLMKALALLNKLDISFRTLQLSRIGIPINGIATAGKNVKLGIDYECGNDQVKLKATDLIKKWKAIRDASNVGRVEANSRRIMRKQHMLQQAGRSGEFQQRAASDAPRGPPTQTHDQSHPSSGSFVLNILDSMVEQREKERKRKLAMKEAQRNSLFKVAKTVDNGISQRQGDSDVTPAHMDTPSEHTESAAESAPTASVPNSGDKAAESRKELQSLMNFFKTFKPQTTATATATTTAAAVPTTDAQGPSSTYPGAGPYPPPSYQSVSPSSDLTGLSFPSNNITHMNNFVGATGPPVPAPPGAMPPNMPFRLPTFMGGRGMDFPTYPPWK